MLGFKIAFPKECSQQNEGCNLVHFIGTNNNFSGDVKARTVILAPRAKSGNYQPTADGQWRRRE